jgi:hypothetical protein
MLRAWSFNAFFIILIVLFLTAESCLAAQQTSIGPAACTSGRGRGKDPLTKPLTDLYARDLITKYGPVPEVPVRFENQDSASLIITGARVTLVNHPSGDGYVAKAIIDLANTKEENHWLQFTFYKFGARRAL